MAVFFNLATNIKYLLIPLDKRIIYISIMFDYDDFDFQEFMEEEREIQRREEERRRKQNNE